MAKDEESGEIVEGAKAAQEIAKTTGMAIDAADKLGTFIARITGGSLKQAFSILEDTLKYARWKRSVRLMMRARELLKEVGLEEATRTIPLKVAIPLLQAASLEEDDELQDIWARLLVNAANADSGVDVERMYISILEDFGPLEARVLQTIYDTPSDLKSEGIRTALLPDATIDEPTDTEPTLPPEPVQLALWNLVRLGCVTPMSMWKGKSIGVVQITHLGAKLIEACTLQYHH